MSPKSSSSVYHLKCWRKLGEGLHCTLQQSLLLQFVQAALEPDSERQAQLNLLWACAVGMSCSLGLSCGKTKSTSRWARAEACATRVLQSDLPLATKPLAQPRAESEVSVSEGHLFTSSSSSSSHCSVGDSWGNASTAQCTSCSDWHRALCKSSVINIKPHLNLLWAVQA